MTSSGTYATGVISAMMSGSESAILHLNFGQPTLAQRRCEAERRADRITEQ